MAQPRSITCPSCRTWIEDRHLSRCPSCGEVLDSQALPSLPRELTLDASDLQEPAFAEEPGARQDDTAPVSEFAAADAVLGGIVLLIAGAILASGTVALIGIVVMFGVTGFFAVTKGSMGHTLDHYRRGMFGGLFGRRRRD